ncbi:DUF1566 domain-containing protein [Microbulbifer sp. TYP-18]|uniref:DUF1566 domain-containing protein n=1 Tax=Microbulbifer sp. TYP-18 TaxID=3230024 RepID=UPI0034C65BBA
MQKPNVKTTTTESAGNLEWSSTLLDGAAVTYEAAENAVTELGNGWRLPTLDELETLVDRSCYDPAIDTEKFPDTRNQAYWTSTPFAWNETAVWVVNFNHGHVDIDHRSHWACVRAVRTGQGNEK